MKRRPKRIQTVLIQCYVLFILFAFVIIAGVSVWLFNIILNETIINQVRQDMQIASGEILAYISELETVSSTIAQDSDIVNYIKWINSGSEPDRYSNYEKVQQRLEDMVRYEIGMYALGIYGLDLRRNNYAGRLKVRELYPNMPLDPDYASLSRAEGRMIWSDPFPWQYGASNVFSLQRVIADTHGMTAIGSMTIILQSNYLNILLKNIARDTSCRFYLLHRDKTVAASDESSEQLFSDKVFLNQIHSRSSGLIMSKTGGSSGVIAFDTLRNGWQMISVNSTQRINQRLASVRRIIWLICAVTCIMTMWISLYVSKRLSRPIYMLAERACGIDLSGNVLEVTNDDTFVETAALSRGINKMLERIDELVIKNYEQQIRERDVRIEMLQAQINPHFLYNTLDVINAKLVLNEDYTTATMVMALADLMRYSISDATQKLTLREELEYVYKYLFIQKERLGKDFSYQITITREAEEALVLKMLIQPIVENAIQHGLRGEKHGGRVTIDARRVGKQLVIQISDNGIGMTQEMIDQMLVDESALHSSSATHVGIRNVYNRMVLTYGKENGAVEIHSREGAGTTVTLKLPYLRG